MNLVKDNEVDEASLRITMKFMGGQVVIPTVPYQASRDRHRSSFLTKEDEKANVAYANVATKDIDFFKIKEIVAESGN